MRSEFSGSAEFLGVQFNGTANFTGVDFEEDAKFYRSEFCRNANFGKSNFHRNANFYESKLIEDADFSESQFNELATFVGTHFNGNASFDKSQFRGNVAFKKASFDNIINLNSTFYERLDLDSCGYGVRLRFVLIWMVGLIIVFGIINYLSGNPAPESAFMSTMTFTASLPNNALPMSNNLRYAFVVERFLGTIFIALFVVVLTKKLIR